MNLTIQCDREIAELNIKFVGDDSTSVVATPVIETGNTAPEAPTLVKKEPPLPREDIISRSQSKPKPSADIGYDTENREESVDSGFASLQV